MLSTPRSRQGLYEELHQTGLSGVLSKVTKLADCYCRALATNNLTYLDFSNMGNDMGNHICDAVDGFNSLPNSEHVLRMICKLALGDGFMKTSMSINGFDSCFEVFCSKLAREAKMKGKPFLVKDPQTDDLIPWDNENKIDDNLNRFFNLPGIIFAKP